MKYALKALRVACFLALPLFFLQQELTPQPIKNMLLAFVASALACDILILLVRNTRFSITFFYPLPLIAVLATVLPYLSMINYFELHDQLIIAGTMLSGVFYYLDRKYIRFHSL